MSDADRLRKSLHHLLLDRQQIGLRQPVQIAVIGAGANGVELACKLADLVQNAGQVTLIDRQSRILRGFSIAFLIRRFIYLLRLPTGYHKLRVGTDWLLNF